MFSNSKVNHTIVKAYFPSQFTKVQHSVNYVSPIVNFPML